MVSLGLPELGLLFVFLLDASLYRMTMDGLFHSSRQWNVRDKRRAKEDKSN